ncbi:hypothetical protein CG709_13745, partial [Lachnotalea glycerini]
MTKKMVAVLLTVSMVTGLMGCGASSKNTLADQTSDTQEGSTQAQGNEEYTFGADKTFYSDEPVSYSMLFSDHENYPYKEDWLLWQAIEEKTNVT